MSLGFVKKGAPSSASGFGNVETPTSVQLSGNGLRAFIRCKEVNSYDPYSFATVYKGVIRAADWNGSEWSGLVAGLGGSTGGGEIFDDGAGFVSISANGQSVGWDFKYYTPNTNLYKGISVSGSNPITYFSFVATNQSAPSSANGSAITVAANASSTNYYTPIYIFFSNDSSLRFVCYNGSNGFLIEINAGIPGERPSLFFPSGGTYGDNFLGLAFSGNGNHVFIFIGGSIKVFSWNGSNWDFSYEFPSLLVSNSSTFSANFDGSIIAIQNSGVKVYKKTGGIWAQLGSDLPDGNPRVNSSGTLVNIKGATSYNLYSWNGSIWSFARTFPSSPYWTGNAISDNGEIAIAPASAGSIQRYEIQDVAPLYKGGTIASAIYAGSTPASSVYYGSQKLWP